MNIKYKMNRIISRNKTLSKIKAIYSMSFMKRNKRNQINSIIKTYVDEDKITNTKYIKKLMSDILFSELYYGINTEEYFRYQFECLSDVGRKEYVGDRESTAKFIEMDNPEVYSLLRNKYSAYLKFKAFYGRDVISVEKNTDREEFFRFCEKHKTFIVKPQAEKGGQGIYKVNVSIETDIGFVFNEIINKGQAVVEELIEQSVEMAKFHPESVNTIRIVTANFDGKVEIVQCSVRLGTGDSIVDNGCLSAAVDKKTGIILTLGRSAHSKERCLVHPDTQVQILGNKISQWEDLINLAEELALVIPNQRIVGWDFALSKKGWVIVEANTHPAIQILAGNGIGMRSVFEYITK